MDSNLVEIVRTVIAENQKGAPAWTVTLKEIFAIATPFFMGLIMWYQKRHDDKLKVQEAAIKTTSESTEKTAKVVEKIEENVNSERTKMIESLKIMNEAFVDVAKENATYKEQKRVSDAAIIAAAAIAKQEQPVQMHELKELIKTMIENEANSRKNSETKPNP